MQLKGIEPFSVYGVLTVQKMAEHLKCSPKAVYERALAGELLFSRRHPDSMTDTTPRSNSMNAWASYG